MSKKEIKQTITSAHKLIAICAIFFLLIDLAIAFWLISTNKHKPSDNQLSIEQSQASIETTKAEEQPIPEINTEPAKKEFSLPILMYHYIRDYNDPNDTIGTNLSVSPSKFDQQMQAIKDRGYTPIRLDQINTANMPDKAIVVTFDDGYSDAYLNAYPILKKYGFTATFYVITGKVGESNYLNWAQIKEMAVNDMTIGSHTVTHPSLENTSDLKATKEMAESKTTLEQQINKPVTDFCYPSGKYNDETIKLLQNAGYATATTTKSGIANQDNSLLELPRIRVTNETNLTKYLP